MKTGVLYRQICAACYGWKKNGDEKEGLAGEAEFLFPADFIGFFGHFPEQAILPAVVQLGAVRCLASRLVGCGLSPTGYRRAKFRQVVFPETAIRLEIVLHSQEVGWNGTFRFSGGGELIAEGGCSLICGGNDDE